MPAFQPPNRLLIIDIDGLRQDVFRQALETGQAPNLKRLMSGPGAVHLNPVSTVPSITFCAQSSIFTGRHPDRHGIPGNQFFDRFGLRSGSARFYAFDVGDALAYQDAVLTFTGPQGLLDQTLNPETPTLYEMASARGLKSTVVYHMLSRGAATWVRPSLIDIARFTKGGGLLGMSAEAYDREMMNQTLAQLQQGALPNILTVYFMGLDHVSHHDGPGAQLDYLCRIVDVELGRLIAGLEQQAWLNEALIAVVSDHGQIEVVPDDAHSLRLSFPFDREMGYLFDALGLDVHDVPGEGPDCEAVVASNGGVAHVYLRRKGSLWSDVPRLEDDVLPVARAFWEAHTTGRYAPDLHGSLAMVLVRDAEHHGWEADYQALTPDGTLIPLGTFFERQSQFQAVDPVARLRHLAGPLSGDLLLVSDYSAGFYFGGPTRGVHGGLHPQDSLCVTSLNWYGGTADQCRAMIEITQQTVEGLLRDEDRTSPCITDLLPVLSKLFQWQE